MGMGKRVNSSSSLLLLFLSSLLLLRQISAAKKSFVVYLGSHSHGGKVVSEVQRQEEVTDFHYEFLGSVLGSKEDARDAIFYSYTRHINGFAANLGEEEALEISKLPGVISVFPNRGRQLHTTRAWEFLRLERDGGLIPKESIWAKSRFGQDTIIGNLDTGVWPDSDSFRDEGMGPIPLKWKGECQKSRNGTEVIPCNRKLIGAKYFNTGYKSAVGKLNESSYSALDHDGHGTHTLSTAGGRFVPNANVFGYGNGTAKGGSPNARVAAYKVCWPPVNGSECFDADILAGFEAAIEDGVDVLTVSLGGTASDYFNDGIAIGAFHAVKKGITVLCSAGNSGPEAGAVSNIAPWIITVGANTMDREFPSYAVLGNGTNLKGQSLSDVVLPKNKFYPLISAVDAKSPNSTAGEARLCSLGSLDSTKVKGKVVACLRGVNARIEKGEAVRRAGGVGMVLANNNDTGNEILADAHVLPATHISYSDGVGLFSYIKSSKSPMVQITHPTTELGTTPAPFMAAFSSPGPNTITPGILKPDITAPGVSIIAAYTQATGPSSQPFDQRRVRFNSLSGTSMSCPLTAGIAGLLKTLHPDWSPAAIKSAIMTSARVRDNRRELMLNSSFLPATPFDYGSGQVRPNPAMDPGLVYDVKTEDYLDFLCSIGYNSTKVKQFSTKPYSCPSKTPKVTDFNYPSITIPNLSNLTTVRRRVKNVGSSPAKYTVRVVPPAGVVVTVNPNVLDFGAVGVEKSFEVSFQVEGEKKKNNNNKKKNVSVGGSGYRFGSMIWSDGVHYVRSPLVVNLKLR